MGTERTLSKRYESLDYDLIENVIYLEHKHKSPIRSFIYRDLQRWVAIFLIAFVAAMSGFFACYSVKTLTTFKFSKIIQVAEESCPQTLNSTELGYYQKLNCILWPYIYWLTWNVFPSLAGGLLVTYIAPVAAGSGIPVVKCYLNGVKIPEVVRLKTYLTKLVGVVASVVGGLAAGKEGPFIHCGAAIGAGISQGKSSSLKFDIGIFKSFRNDRDKRDFVSAGASAGVAAAFGAPIGGVLFALEEGASFWNQALTWRLFFCSMMTSFILNLLMAAYNQTPGMLAFYSLVNFGLVEELDYFWFEIPVYICIAILGGAIGASFCYLNLVLTRFRKAYLSSYFLKVVEVVFVAAFIATCGMALIVFLPDCQPMPQSPAVDRSAIGLSNPFSLSKILFQSWSTSYNKTRSAYDSDNEQKKALEGHIFKFLCPPNHFSAMSSLWLKTSEGASSTFMVLQEDIWSIKTLVLFLIVYYVLAVITYGLSVSSGVFIPSLLIGATAGRLIGMLLKRFLGPLGWLLQPNKFAIIGAASVLGGVVRMTISLTVIIIEATGCISFGMPIMICLMVSKWVADFFIEGLYDLAIHQANVPFLDWEPPLLSYSIYASDVMYPNVKVLRTTESVGTIIDILRSTTHNGFPVVDLDEQDREVTNESRRRRSRSPLDQSSGNLHYQSVLESPSSRQGSSPSRLRKSLARVGSTHSATALVDYDCLEDRSAEAGDCLSGSFQRCTVQAKRESQGRFRGLVLRWQLLVMLDQKMFNENERCLEQLSLPTFQNSYPRYPDLYKVIAGLNREAYNCHVDLRSIMNPTPYNVLYSSSFPRIYQLFRSLGLRHLCVVDDRNQVVGMITRKDLARYVSHRDQDGSIKFTELKYSS